MFSQRCKLSSQVFSIRRKVTSVGCPLPSWALQSALPKPAAADSLSFQRIDVHCRYHAWTLLHYGLPSALVATCLLSWLHGYSSCFSLRMPFVDIGVSDSTLCLSCIEGAMHNLCNFRHLSTLAPDNLTCI